MKRKRQSTVEPVFGTLTQFMGLRKINTLGIQQANKVMHLSAMAYNLKKYVKFTQKLVKSEAKSLAFVFSETILFIKMFWPYLRLPKKQHHSLLFF
ncbi:transposase [Flavobacteriaceae bacterium]|nr:transposase [Flavobacteriaceae bacterium]